MKITKQMAQEFAALYVNGPKEVRGKWAEASLWAGFPETPPADHPFIRAAIEAEGGMVPNLPRLLPPSTEKSDDDIPFTDYIPIDETIAQAEAIREDSEWRAMAKRLMWTMEAIADGRLKATAAQVSAIKHIFERAEGRVSEKSKDVAAPIGVVKLPNAEFTCPQCGYHNVG